ncbi:MAG TPA: CHAT domain-containing protein [Candidatus Binataceae bacterium]|nr:CHAT domain-containing protein [Candidatus Binataceae bacterium]
MTSNPQIPIYLVFFRPGTSSNHYTLTVGANRQIASYLNGEVTLDYGFDRALASIFPALWFILHLPRSRFDLQPLQSSGLKKGQRLHLPHHVLLIPISVDRDLLAGLNNAHRGSPKIVFVPDQLLVDARDILSLFSDVVHVTRLSEVGKQQLPYHWADLYNAFDPKGSLPAKVVVTRLIENSLLGPSLLPAQFVGRNMNEGIDERVPSEFQSQEKVLEYALQCQKVASLIAKLEAERTPREVAERVFLEKLTEEHSLFRCPVAIGIRGLPRDAFRSELQQRLDPSIRESRQIEDRKLEESVLGLVVAHRALARGGVGLIAKQLNQEAFEYLANLEATWSNAAASNPREVWHILTRIGELVKESFERGALEAIHHATSVTAFCEFPIGIGILRQGDDPLGLTVPIHYRPLIPLTHTLQFELAPVATRYLKRGFKLLIAECTSSDSLLGKLSRIGWDSGRKVLTDITNIEYKLEEFSQPEALRAELARGKYDALVISAHGGLDPDSGRTCFACGDGFVVEEELGNLPPIICLSACQVSPRGTGSVNVSDLFLRRGAYVVIGPTVPINVRHNSMLMARFFANLAATIDGDTDMRTLEDVWLHTTATNAINDILSANESLQEWAITRDDRGRSVLEEFMMSSSVKRLRRGRIYADTEDVLLEIARERGMEHDFRAWTAKGYVPESAMYLVMGWPDLFVLHDADFDETVATKPSVVG